METNLITGVNGFVGQALFRELKAKGVKVRGTLRNRDKLKEDSNYCLIEGLSGETDWSQALNGVDIVYHLASTVHQPHVTDAHIYNETITQASINLAQQAHASGVKRFVYVSTAHIYGLKGDTPFKEDNPKNPTSFYAKAKLAAEDHLLAFAQKHDWDVVVIRPPLVYGRGVKANFGSLLNLVKKSKILPLGHASSQRSFVGIHNLVHFLYTCAIQDKAKNQVFNVTDHQDVSVAQLCQFMAEILEKNIYLIPIPKKMMKIALISIMRHDLYEKLFEPLQLDGSKAQSILNWRPIFTMQDELRKIFRD